MKTIEELQIELKNILSEKRYTHSIGVMKKAKELAKIYDVDNQQAEIAGLLHDIAKEMSIEESLKYIEENNIQIDEIEKQTPSLLHAKIGADIVKKKYNLSEEIQNAIKYHTTGNINMDKLAKIIYVADKTEENRNFEGVEELRKVAEQGLDLAVFEILSYDISKNIKKKRMIHPDSILIRNNILKKL